MKSKICILIFLLLVGIVSAADSNRAYAMTAQPIPTIETTVVEGTVEETSTCPSEEVMKRQIDSCVSSGMNYAKAYDENKCLFIQCVVPPTEGCPAEVDLNKAITACKEKRMSYAVVESNGCKAIKCLEEDAYICQTADQLENQMSKCKENGLDFKTYEKAGCKFVSCADNTRTGLCKKSVNGNCVQISCDDGYFFDSCTFCSGVKPVPPEVTTSETKPGVKVPNKKETYLDPQPEPPLPGINRIRECIASQNPDDVSDENVWAVCAKQLGNSDELKKTKECVKKSAGSDDVWSNCGLKEVALNPQPEPPTPEDSASDNLGKTVEDAKQKTQLNPQPEPPIFKRIGNFFSGIFR
jgi:hypothetical protein